MTARSTRIALLWALTAFAICGTARTSIAQGILYPQPEIRIQPFFVKSVHVHTVINDGLAETTVEQTFVNDSRVEQEGTYLFPLPDGATVTSFSLRAGDRVVEAKVLRKEEARAIYESIVRRRKDPALLEYLDRGLFRSSVFPIPPHGERALTLKYAEVLKSEGGLRKFMYPLTTGRFSARPVSNSSVSVRLHTSVPMKTVYSPTHDVSVRRTGDNEATASWEGTGEIPDRDFLLYFSTSADDVGLSLLTYPTGIEGGYFMLVAAPRFSIPKEKILPKQVVFVLDRTGSMLSNGKITQAKNALKYCLDSLNPNDRFNVLTFNESVDFLNRSPITATHENIEKAQRFIRDVDASGGTNIDEALKAGIVQLRSETGTQKMIVFMTDGLPTVGETDVETILRHVAQLNSGDRLVSTSKYALRDAVGANVRIFSFGVGYDVNVPFLDRLADQTHAQADYVRPEENIESIVSSFFAKVSSPILTNLKLDFDGVEVYDTYPKMLPDLFKGGQLIVAGRYRGAAPGTVRLSGSAQGQTAAYKLPHAFGDSSAHSSLVSRIWATRKIGYLLDQVRLKSNQEVIDEIVRLSKEYGIITPYTSYLADDRQDGIVRANNGPLPGITSYDVNSTVMLRLGTESKRELEHLRDRDEKASVGAEATGRALNSQGYQNANRAPASSQGGFAGSVGGRFGGGMGGMGGGGRGGYSLDYGRADYLFGANGQGMVAAGKPAYQQAQNTARVQAVGGRIFYRRNDVWFDNNYPSGQRVVKIQALSDAHFQLLNVRPDLGKFAAVGDEVVVNLGKVSVQIGKDGKDKLTESDLKELASR